MAAPVLGPVLYRLLHPHPRAVDFVDGFVYLAVPLLVAWQVLPHAWDDRSAMPLVVVTAGFLLPALVERGTHALARQTDNVALVVGISGLALHAALEGAARAPGAVGVDGAFGLAVIVHRIPVGLVIWWLVRPRFGPVAAGFGVASLVFATLAGWGLGSEILGEAHDRAELFQIFVSGSLVHVVYHQGRHDHDHSGDGPHVHDHGRTGAPDHEHGRDEASAHDDRAARELTAVLHDLELDRAVELDAL